MTETLLEHQPQTSRLMGLEELDNFTTQKEFTRCGLCENNCALTVTIFNDGSKFVTGNRCERGATKKKTSLITNIKNFLNLKLSQNVTLSMALSAFLVCSICMKTIPFGTPF